MANNSFQKIRENTHNFYTVKKALYKYICPFLGTKCSFTCNPGYKLKGSRKSTTCSKKDSEWKHQMPKCETDFPKPFIMCPSDITKPLTGRTGSVYVMIPQPKTNVDWSR